MKYAVITTKSIHHEGDERSRTNPGHGYPAYTEEVESIQRFANQEDLKRWIRLNSSKKFEVIEYQTLEVKTELQVEFKRPATTRLT